MQPVHYFRPSYAYFWQYDEDYEIIQFIDGDTICYTEALTTTIQALSVQGLPPFSTLLLAISAAGKNGSEKLKKINAFTNTSTRYPKTIITAEAIEFLELISKLPERYKSSKGVIQLVQFLFYNCHRIQGLKYSKQIAASISIGLVQFLRESMLQEREKNKDPDAIYEYDFRIFSILHQKYNSLDALLAALKDLPELDEPIIPEVNNQPKDYIDELQENPSTFHVAALVRSIWTGLHLPYNHSSEGSYSTGGIATLSNKGSLDKLLITEFAHDDLVFLSRIANKEALYFQRENPSIQQPFNRIILIDVSIRNWGTPKLISAAILLATSQHPKSTICVKGYAVGDFFTPLSIDSKEDVAYSISQADISLDASAGVEEFIKKKKPDSQTEWIFISEEKSLQSAGIQKIVQKYPGLFSYMIAVSSSGKISLFKYSSKGKSLIQSFTLPIHKLWKKIEKNKALKRVNKQSTDHHFPILFGISGRNIIPLPIDQETYLLSGTSLFKKNHPDGLVGFSLVYELKENKHSLYSIGRNKNNELILLCFNSITKQITLCNLETLEIQKLDFPAWTNSAYPHFHFIDNKFYYVTAFNYSIIDLEEKATISTLEGIPDQSILSSYTYYRMNCSRIVQEWKDKNPILKKLKTVAISASGEIFLNSNKLIKENGFYKIVTAGNYASPTLTYGIWKDENRHEFRDGSSITLHRSGMLLLTSSNKTLPTIFLPTVLGVPIAAVANNDFTGTSYFIDPSLQQNKIGAEEFNSSYLNPFIQTILALGNGT
ncbi:hypothetical protein [Flavihumibacter sp. CACIAM 22H1]|uniref:hypothetical protein n=1 Tax=Flavihumibacter sp. CACIAM 22H1 TaxID=1812911 RepID=UPI0007A7D0A0|nr:hypothetical protein [Flavihumibacter sp. CACIAM 22H1]KYP15344.1 MAG: hypothetical protein A1D16_15705 [Flavihumibacter sp. CACIAM 22H1]